MTTTTTTASTTGCIDVSDFGAGAALAMHGIFPVSRRVDGRQHVLLFTDTPRTREIIDDYRAGRLTGSLLTFRLQFSALTRTLREPRQ